MDKLRKRKLLVVILGVAVFLLLLVAIPLVYIGFGSSSGDSDSEGDLAVNTDCEYEGVEYQDGDEFMTSDATQTCVCDMGTVVCSRLEESSESEAGEGNGDGSDSGSQSPSSTSSCFAEGESYPIVESYETCCSGLQPISCAKVDGAGICLYDCVGASICAKCGNGSCGAGENKCNCPEDCDNTEVCEGMSLARAQGLAKYTGDCSSYGTVNKNGTCIASQDMWSFAVDGTGKDDLCDPTCYVNTQTEEVTFNWQCTGQQ